MLLRAHEAARDENRDLIPAHAPQAAIVSCSDARVPPSIIFDQHAGSLFVVRVAGNTATPPMVASLDYAVTELGVPLIVVLGHTNCGAVAAAVDGACQGHLEPITSQICGLIAADEPVDPDELGERNVVATMTALAASPSPVGEHIRAGSVEIRGAVYDVKVDRITPVDPPGSLENEFTTSTAQPTTAQPTMEKT